MTADKRTHMNMKVFFLEVQKASLNEQEKSNVLHLFQNGIMRDVFSDFDFIAVLVYYCLNKKFLTYLYSTDDGKTFRKAYANFYFLKK